MALDAQRPSIRMIYYDSCSPTHVLSSCASCRPADGQRQRISPWTSSHPYWQWAREQVLESACMDASKTTHTQIMYSYANLAACFQLYRSKSEMTHWRRIHQSSVCSHWGSSTCSCHSCSCSDAHRAEVSGRTRSDLQTGTVRNFLKPFMLSSEHLIKFCSQCQWN